MQDDLLKLKVDGVTPEKLALSLCSTSKNNDSDLDLFVVGALEKQLLDIISVYKSRLPECIILSLRPVRYIDSEGLFFCMQMYTLFQEKGCRLVFTDVSSDVLRVLKMTRLDQKIMMVLFV
tara:strand:+ start:445 stop:807 length:363 start_codon:yes stop_codon:yes gene_type:complete